jgi:hypothetical protein
MLNQQNLYGLSEGNRESHASPDPGRLTNFADIASHGIGGKLQRLVVALRDANASLDRAKQRLDLMIVNAGL